MSCRLQPSHTLSPLIAPSQRHLTPPKSMIDAAQFDMPTWGFGASGRACCIRANRAEPIVTRANRLNVNQAKTDAIGSRPERAVEKIVTVIISIAVIVLTFRLVFPATAARLNFF